MITMEESLISIGTSPYFKDEAEDNFKIFSQIFRDCQDIRRCGSASLDLSHVACGCIDGYMEKHLKLWDYAAGVLIVREAGGNVLNYEGQELPMELDGNVVAGNRLLFLGSLINRVFQKCVVAKWSQNLLLFYCHAKKE